MAFLLALLVMISVGALAVAVWLGISSQQKTDVVRRLESVEKARKRKAAEPEVHLVRNELLSDVPQIHRLLLRLRGVMRLQEFLIRAGVRAKPGKFILASAALAVAAFAVAQGFGLHILYCSAIAIGACLIPIGLLSMKLSRRLRAFEKNFPDALDLLARAVRAGHAFTTGLEMVSKELPEPVAGEFRAVFEEQNFGLPLKDALLNLADRVPLIDVRFFVTALLIQKETGGNLAEILSNLSSVIRERFQIYGEVRVRTAQGKLTALILIGLPIMVMVILRTVNPDYIKPLFEDPWGPYMLGSAATMQIVGSAILWKIVHIEV